MCTWWILKTLSQAFSSDELASAKHRTILVNDLQTKTDLNWKGSRWVMDLVTLARAKEQGVLPVQQAFAQNVTKTSSDSIASIMSADATLVSNEKTTGEDYVPSRQDQHLQIGGTNLKCSRSENILATLGHQQLHGGKEQMDSFLNPPEYHSSQPDSLASPHKFASGISIKEKACSNTSTNVVSGAAGNQEHGSSCSTKAAFASGRLSYASHSQSETSISVLATQCSSPSSGPTHFYSPSLHNLCKTGSESEGSLHAATGGASDDGSSGGLLPGQHADNVSQLSINLSERLPIPSNSVDGSSPMPSSSPIPLDLITTQGLFVNNLNNHQRQSSSSSSAVSEANETSMTFISSFTSTSATKPGLLVRPLVSTAPSSPGLESSSIRQTKIVAVYAAYACGLAPGTCVRLQITNHTTARQILNLLIKHLSAAVLARGMDGPIYDNYQDFCLGSYSSLEVMIKETFLQLLLIF